MFLSTLVLNYASMYQCDTLICLRNRVSEKRVLKVQTLFGVSNFILCKYVDLFVKAYDFKDTNIQFNFTSITWHNSDSEQFYTSPLWHCLLPIPETKFNASAVMYRCGYHMEWTKHRGHQQPPERHSTGEATSYPTPMVTKFYISHYSRRISYW